MRKTPLADGLIPDSYRTISRRNLLAGAGGVAGLAAGFAPDPAGAALSMDLNSPEDNLQALIKLQADLSGADVLSGFPGEVWGWVPGEGNTLLFRSYGIGASHVERVENGWRFYHREVLYYLDPQSGEILQSWDNPYTGQRVEVLHILNDPVHRFYALSGGRFAAPFPYTVQGDELVFRISVFSFRESPLSRAEYPLHSAHDQYQAAELWTMCGRLSEVANPAVTSARCVTAWARVGQWLPFMEMGNRPGIMVYHSDSYKLLGGAADLPASIRTYTEKHHPEYLESPRKWQDLALNESQVTESKKIIDERWNSPQRPVGSVFGQN